MSLDVVEERPEGHWYSKLYRNAPQPIKKRPEWRYRRDTACRVPFLYHNIQLQIINDPQIAVVGTQCTVSTMELHPLNGIEACPTEHSNLKKKRPAGRFRAKDSHKEIYKLNMANNDHNMRSTTKLHIATNAARSGPSGKLIRQLFARVI